MGGENIPQCSAVHLSLCIGYHTFCSFAVHHSMLWIRESTCVCSYSSNALVEPCPCKRVSYHTQDYGRRLWEMRKDIHEGGLTYANSRPIVWSFTSVVHNQYALLSCLYGGTVITWLCCVSLRSFRSRPCVGFAPAANLLCLIVCVCAFPITQVATELAEDMYERRVTKKARATPATTQPAVTNPPPPMPSSPKTSPQPLADPHSLRPPAQAEATGPPPPTTAVPPKAHPKPAPEPRTPQAHSVPQLTYISLAPRSTRVRQSGRAVKE